ncbi:M12 family metallopeptidase [Idiomarina abyssalis]|uniref:M12 family metallopeptidase n=1 Tax=Idiomarina abyssalis TaxID=86102 RepID=UPI0006C8C7D3|nr:M12 family metallopeptidase [Idiomarina abyssalis]SFT59025.1 Astacin (Peptidase family M12A) [Idiomarina abyssalis]
MGKQQIKAGIFLLAVIPLFSAANTETLPTSQTETITANIELLTNQGSEQKEVTLTVIGNQAYFEGDIFVGYVDESGQLVDSQQNLSKDSDGFVGTQSVVVSNSSLRWPNAVVPYTISSSYFDNPQQVQSAISLAMEQIEDNSGIKFVPRSGHVNYVDFEPSSNGLCSSKVGMQGGRQAIRLAGYCQSTDESHVGTIIHEILHALGFYHMHTRADRDNYITVNYSNIKPDHHHNFDKYTFSDSSVVHVGNYDLQSIMHYGRFTYNSSFVYDVSEPMLTVHSDPNATTGNNNLSSTDKSALQEIYGALEAPTLSGVPSMCRGRAQLDWNSISGADEYIIERSLSAPGYWTQLKTTTSTSTTVNLSTSGNLRVKACTTSGACSLPSNSFYVHYYSPCL